MRSALLALFLGLISLPAAAQPETLFGSGTDVPVIKEEDFDRRFLKTGLYQALSRGTNDANCAQLLGGMLTLLAETAPLIHKRDENFYLDPGLIQALNTQLTNPRFQANAYMVAMVRRVLIDHKLSPDWFKTASDLGPLVGTIDVGKLRFISEGLDPIDSFFATLPVLRDRYDIEVRRANTTAARSAEKMFRESYVDRTVAFGGVEMIDVRVEQPKKPKKRKKNDPPVEPEPPTAVAQLVWLPPDASAGEAQDLWWRARQEGGGQHHRPSGAPAVPGLEPHPQGHPADGARPALGLQEGHGGRAAARRPHLPGSRLVQGQHPGGPRRRGPLPRGRE